MDALPLICVFPYVQIHEPLHIRGETLYPYNTIESIDIDSDDKERLKEIQSYFYWYNNKPITTLAWAILPTGADEKRIQLFKTHLEEIRKILGYLCCRIDERPQSFSLYFYYEQVDYFLFLPDRHLHISLPRCVLFKAPAEDVEYSDRYVDGYLCYRNEKYEALVMKGCRIYPSSHDIRPSFALDRMLAPFQMSEAFLRLFEEKHFEKRDEDRLFTAIEWHNRSCSATAKEDLALLCLAFAFETLLGTLKAAKDDSKSPQDKTLRVIRILVGNYPRLDAWFTDFYQARSNIVHEGQTEALNFLPQDTKYKRPGEFGQLTSYGLIIFRICMRAVLHGLDSAVTRDFGSILYTNHERLDQVLRELENEDKHGADEVLERVAPYIIAIHRTYGLDRYVFDLKVAWQSAKRFANLILKIKLNPVLEPEQKSTLERLVDTDDGSIIGASQIINHAVRVVLQNTDQLDQKKVIEPGLKALEQDLSLSEIKKHLEEILNYKNKAMSEDLRAILQNLLKITEETSYREKLKLMADFKTSDKWGSVTTKRPFSLFEAYAEFIGHVISEHEFNRDMYLDRLTYQLTNGIFSLRSTL